MKLNTPSSSDHVTVKNNASTCQQQLLPRNYSLQTNLKDTGHNGLKIT